MRLHRFIGDFDLTNETITVTDTELLNQLRNVLRLRIGDQLTLGDGRGTEALATIIDGDKKILRLAISEQSQPAREPHKKATLFCAVLKRENFELVLQKATEIGITRIVPLLTERTVKTGFNKERLEKILREAAEQSGRTFLPELAEPQTLEQALIQVDPKTSIFFDLSGRVQKPEVYRSTTSCFIGPEGGFSEKEVALAQEAGLTIASLGTLTLRGETAAIIATYLLIQ